MFIGVYMVVGVCNRYRYRVGSGRLCVKQRNTHAQDKTEQNNARMYVYVITYVRPYVPRSTTSSAPSSPPSRAEAEADGEGRRRRPTMGCEERQSVAKFVLWVWCVMAWHEGVVAVS